MAESDRKKGNKNVLWFEGALSDEGLNHFVRQITFKNRAP